MARESVEQRRARLMPGAQWLRGERERRGWTGTELARRLGVAQERVSAYERAQDEPPPEVARSLAEEFGMTELAVWQALRKPLPRELTRAQIESMTDEQAIAYVRQRWPGAIEDILEAAAADVGTEVATEKPRRKASRRGKPSAGIPQEGDSGRSASHG